MGILNSCYETTVENGIELKPTRKKRFVKRDYNALIGADHIYCDAGKKYSVPKLVELSQKIGTIKVEVERLASKLRGHPWDDEYCDVISPQDVIDNPKISQTHWLQIQNANLKYPILIQPSGEIVDGFHRLAKAQLHGKKWIKAKIIPPSIMNKAEIVE